MVYVVEMIDTMIKSSILILKKALKKRRKFFRIVIVAIIANNCELEYSRGQVMVVDRFSTNIIEASDPKWGTRFL
jgi:hypothetical protein